MFHEVRPPSSRATLVTIVLQIVHGNRLLKLQAATRCIARNHPRNSIILTTINNRTHLIPIIITFVNSATFSRVLTVTGLKHWGFR
jgi:hypothetical protein